MRKIVLVIVCSLSSIGIYSQNLNSNWEKDLTVILYQFMSCRDSIDNISPCNKFVSEALKAAYYVEDFYDEKKKRHMLANEIYDYLETSPRWLLLGSADDQDVLNSAQKDAGSKKAVIAVLKGETNGHVALIMPGKLSKSPSWKLNVPNSASFFLNKPDKSYIGKHLGFAFPSAEKKNVLIYTRIY